jgi:hypothetical protein
MLAVLLAPAGARAEPLPAVTETRLVTDFSADLPADDADATISLRFVDIRPLRDGAAGDVVVQLQRRGGQWADRGHNAAADYNQRSSNSVEIVELDYDGTRLTGTIKVAIGPDSPRPRVTGFPSPPDEFEITLQAQRQPGKFLPFQPDTMAFMAPWRKDVPWYGGELIRGAYTAKRGQTVTEGNIAGGINPAPVRGKFGAQGNLTFGPAAGGGLRAVARLAPHRVAPPQGAEAVKLWDTPQDWSRWDGLRITVDAPVRRNDATVQVGLRRDGGGWHYLNGAALLLGRETQFVVPFTDFRSPLPNVSAVEGIALGVSNQHGVGDVEFVVRKVELARWADGYGARTRPATARLQLDPDTVISFNGVTEIPKGLFGHHDVGESSPRQPREGEPDPFQYMRLLNPGLLRPLTHVGFGGTERSDEQLRERIARRLAEPKEPDTVFYRRAQAANAVDNVLWCHTTDLWARPQWMDQGIERTAENVRLFYRNLAADCWVPGDQFNVLRKLEVWNEPFMWGRHFNMGHMNPPGRKAWVDQTQYGYIPGQVGSDAWSEMFLAAVAGARSINPHVKLGGPSSPSLGGDDFGVLAHHVIPILDRVHDKLDFITEHHYGGNPRSFAASYEVLTAYTDTRHGRRIPVYNTEANDLGASSAGKAWYNIMDILACIQVCPDKALGRSLHALWNGYLRDEGEQHAYIILNNLRGKILPVTVTDPDVVAVASSPRDGEVVVFAINDAPGERRVELPVPAGFRLAGAKLLLAQAPDAELQLHDTEGQPIPKPATGKTVLSDLTVTQPQDGQPLAIELPRRSAVRWTLSKDGHAPAKILERRQHFVDVALARVAPDKPVTAKVLWRDAGPAGARSATLRVVTSDVHRGEAVALINGTAVPLPWSSANDGHAVAQEIPLDAGLLQPDTTVEFRCADSDAANGYTVWSASIIVTR